jgi:Holliday junction resolvase RusA-like endonuclease
MDGAKASKYAAEVFKDFDMLLHFKVPVLRHYIKKNSRPIYKNRKTGKTFIGKNKELIEAENYLVRKFQEEAQKIGLFDPINEPIWVIFFFHFTKDQFFTQKGYMRKTIGDLSNLYQLPEDCLEKAGIIENDCLIMAHDYSRKLPSDTNELEIYILKYSNPHISESISEKIAPECGKINQ